MSIIDDLYADCQREISRIQEELRTCRKAGDRRKLQNQLKDARRQLRECSKYRR